jgi:hypothetical protein
VGVRDNSSFRRGLAMISWHFLEPDRPGPCWYLPEQREIYSRTQEGGPVGKGGEGTGDGGPCTGGRKGSVIAPKLLISQRSKGVLCSCPPLAILWALSFWD